MSTTYTTDAKVRNDAGFVNNQYVTDPMIDAQRLRAFAIINSYVGSRYAVSGLLGGPTFSGSPAAQLLESVEILYAGGLLLIQEYGPEGRDTDKDGYRRVADATAMLKDVQAGNIALFGSDGNLLPSVAAANQSRPTVAGGFGDGDRSFSVSDVY